MIQWQLCQERHWICISQFSGEEVQEMVYEVFPCCFWFFQIMYTHKHIHMCTHKYIPFSWLDSPSISIKTGKTFCFIWLCWFLFFIITIWKQDFFFQVHSKVFLWVVLTQRIYTANQGPHKTSEYRVKGNWVGSLSYEAWLYLVISLKYRLMEP
jgi:hypothetical protein